ncbi:MAG: hypothetical protein Q9215_007981 [Flavoplaca cf. flavocitrina]
MYKARRLLSPFPVDKLPSRNLDEPGNDMQKSGAETEVVKRLADIQILEKRHKQNGPQFDQDLPLCYTRDLENGRYLLHFLPVRKDVVS